MYRPIPPTRRNYKLLRELLFIAAFYLLMELIAPRFLVAGPSMQPTFHDDQRLLTSPIPYLLADPQRGHVITFHSPMLNSGGLPLIKRIVGLPGETIEYRDQQLYINGELMPEPYINEACSPAHCPDERWWVGPDQYFVMGDNRNHSNDSRAFGPILRESIIGEALLRFWPPQDWGVIQGIGYQGDSDGQ